jgi:hypothetical protein
MAEQYHLDMLHQRIDVWSQWRMGHHSIQPDFSGVDFSNADLSGIDFSKANTHGARLSKAYFSRRSNTLLDESYQQSLRADTQRQQGKQRAVFDAEVLDERAHEDWANDE